MSLMRSVADASDSTGVSNGFGLAFLRIVHQGRPSPRSLWLVTPERLPVGTDPVAVVVARGSWAKRCTASSRTRSTTRAGVVLVTISADTRMKIENSGTLTHAVAADVNQFATSQPMTPPAAAIPGIPFDGCGIPPAMCARAEHDRTNSPSPTAMRRLSASIVGCRNSHAANRTSTTGRPNAMRPNNPPTVDSSTRRTHSTVGTNHSTVAPTPARTSKKNGSPSRRSSFSTLSERNKRKVAPAA